MKPLVLAYYLPQYHHVKENDLWWGKDFTEWTAVKNAEKYYDSHYEPRIPLKNNYYDLLKKDTFHWQSDLAKEYKVNGFVFFHYYFADGRKILEKPCENLLGWTDIHINYCFSWANLSWTRTWSGIAGGAMNSKFEKYNPSESSILLLQNYGTEESWKEHFEYLLPFFKDKRYIKKNNCPVFIFHNPEDIDCLEEMVACWRKLSKQNGFDDLYLIGNIKNSFTEYNMLDALYAHEPSYLFNEYPAFSDETKKQICTRYNDYAEVSNWSCNRFYYQRQKMYYGTFVGFDNTPRHAHRGAIIDCCTPIAFKQSLARIYEQSIKNNNDMVFINAWNEWGEGNYLEPDERYGFSFLEAVKDVVDGWRCQKKVSAQWISSQAGKVINNISMREQKDKYMADTLDKLLSVVRYNANFEAYLKQKEVKTLAIYGYGKIGAHVFEILKNLNLIKCIIDQKKKIKDFLVPFFSLTDKIPELDLIIVTVNVSLNEIRNKTGCKNVVYLNSLLDDMFAELK